MIRKIKRMIALNQNARANANVATEYRSTVSAMAVYSND